MHLLDHGFLARSTPQSTRASFTFPQVTVLQDGTLLATCRVGASKDGADEAIELYRSTDGGQNWQGPECPFTAPQVDGASGSLKLCYLTPLAPDRLLAAAMWVDRSTYPHQPLFNASTEGCLPMAILLAESNDQGHTWPVWRQVPMPEEIGPPSLTSPILSLGDGTLAMSIETNKQYDDGSPWQQRVVFFHSRDEGQSWGAPAIVMGALAPSVGHTTRKPHTISTSTAVSATTTDIAGRRRRIWALPTKRRTLPCCPMATWCWRGWIALACTASAPV
jgi:hypothetical protein